MDISLILNRRVPGWAVWFVVTLAALAAGEALQSRVYLNHDVSWFGHSARWLLEGREFGREVLDVNPPMAWAPSLPAAVLANAGLMDEPTAIRCVFWGYVLLSAFLLRHVLARADVGQPSGSAGWYASFVLAVTLGAGYSFGQREYLSVTFAMPYLATAAARLQGNVRLGTPLAVSVGLLAGIGFSLKPFFLAVPLMVECLLMVALGWRAVWRAETLTIAGVVAAYLLVVLLFFRDYVTTTIPLGLSFFWAYESASLRVVVDRYAAAVQPAVFGLLIALLTLSWSRRHAIVLLAGLGYSLSYFIQAKGFVYHVYPVMVCAVVFVGVSLDCSIREAWSRLEKSWAGIRALAVSSLCLIGVVSVKPVHDDVVSWFFAYNAAWGPQGAYRSAIIAAVERYAPTHGSYFYAFTTHPFPGFPTASYTKADWAGRGPGQGVVAAVARLDEVKDPSLRQRIGEAATWQRQAVVEDLTRKPPSIVFLDTAQQRLGMAGRAFDDISFYRQDARFRRIWDGYREIPPIGFYRVFVLKDRDHQAQ